LFCAFLWPFLASPCDFGASRAKASCCGKPLPRTYRSSRSRNWRRNGCHNRPLAGGCFDHRQGGALIDEGPYAAPDDHHHVAVLQYLMLIGEVAVARDNQGSTLSFVLVLGKDKYVIQTH